MDGNISSSEERYLKSLYDYNQILINEYKDILGSAYDRQNYNQLGKLEKNIVDIYDRFSNKAEIQLNT